MARRICNNNVLPLLPAGYGKATGRLLDFYAYLSVSRSTKERTPALVAPAINVRIRMLPTWLSGLLLMAVWNSFDRLMVSAESYLRCLPSLVRNIPATVDGVDATAAGRRADRRARPAGGVPAISPLTANGAVRGTPQ